ncbi:MAG: hypothetical protein WDN26_14740 [Chitinophagaceae bacterium]
MKLMMYLGNDLIESVPVDEKDVRIPGYLGKFKRSLKVKYEELIQQHQVSPEFLVTEIVAQMPPPKAEVAKKASL